MSLTRKELVQRIKQETVDVLNDYMGSPSVGRIFVDMRMRLNNILREYCALGYISSGYSFAIKVEDSIVNISIVDKDGKVLEFDAFLKKEIVHESYN